MLVTLTILVTVLAAIVTGALVVLTTSLHTATQSIGASVQGVYFAEEAQIELLLYERANDALVKRDIEGDLRRNLAQARRFVTTDHESSMLDQAESRIDAYITIAHDPRRTAAEIAAHQEAAYGALRGLVTINVAQSTDAQEAASKLDTLADVLGVGVGTLLILVAGTLLVWLKGRAFDPIFHLSAAMDRFGRGDRAVRVNERGLSELREMCVRFNEMASSIAKQREAQLAFLGGVAHDLRNPLAALQMSVALIPPDKALPSEERIRQTVERIRRQIARMDRMLGDFLDFAKIEAGELELRFDTHDARQLVKDAVDLFEGAAPEHHFDVYLPSEPLSLRCDQLRVGQVLANLISNAIKYSPPGSSIEVALEACRLGGVVRVTDHGVGIAEDDQERVFEPFRRVGLSKEAVPGVGLGLFVVRKIIKAHGGRIELESTPGEGSTFRVFLPA